MEESRRWREGNKEKSGRSRGEEGVGAMEMERTGQDNGRGGVRETVRKSQERVDRRGGGRGGVGPTLSTRGSSLYLLTSVLFELQQVHLQTLLHLPRLLLGGCLLGTEPRNLTHTQTHRSRDTGHLAAGSSLSEVV